jgi:uncharacterized membrane protein
MMTMSEVSWFEMGWPAGSRPEVSFLILVLGLLVGIVFVFISYRYTLAPTSPARRVTLSLLRFAGWLALGGILAAPTRIERVLDPPTSARRSAVLIDRSASMTTVDNRQQSRLDDALLKWRKLESAARERYAGIEWFAFARGIVPVGLTSAPADLPPTQTDLLPSLQSTLDHAPKRGWGGIVVLTDGLDTSGEDPVAAQRSIVCSALATNTPLYFVVGRNRTVPQPYVRLRELNVPMSVTPRSTVPIEALFESFQTVESTVSVQLTIDGKPVATRPVSLEGGEYVARWSAHFLANAPGTVAVELRAAGEVARAEVTVQASTPRRILYDSGRLDWGYRYLSRMLRQDDAMTLTPLFSLPEAGVVLPPDTLPRLPATMAGLQRFDAIILADVSAEQVPPAQQQLLARWVRDGGALLFLASGNDTTPGFAGGELEKVLPAVFDRTRPLVAESAVAPEGTPSGLRSFRWEDSPTVREVFPGAGGAAPQLTPRFASQARIERLKPGAEVLARSAEDAFAEGGAVVFAMQRYGAGRTVLLLTDSLWRWRLGSPSDDHTPELFWTNLLLWLTRDNGPGLYFDRPPVRTEPGTDVTYRLTGRPAERVAVVARQGNAQVPVATLEPGDRSREFHWRAPSPGFWQIEAKTEGGAIARCWVSAAPPPVAVDLTGNPPNDALLRSLADQTGGAVLEDVPRAWRPSPGRHAQLRIERREPLWHRGWLLGLLLGLYAVELMLRRRWQLL